MAVKRSSSSSTSEGDTFTRVVATQYMPDTWNGVMQ